MVLSPIRSSADDFHSFEAIGFEPELKQAWKEKGLCKTWADEHSDLFDEDDRRLAGSQARYGYHFVEWLAAIHFKETLGLLSLVSKYQYPSHRRKLEIFRRYAGVEMVEMVQTVRKNGGPQAPDLFLYQPGKDDWLFCEVKGPRDDLRPGQRAFFAKLATASNRPVGIIRVKNT